ncbi:MAG: T9SS type A sorting domain-containing protein [Bacteroidota bacterium]
MKKIKYLFITIILLTCFQLQLFGQNIYWIESVFDSPRLVKTSNSGEELLSKSLSSGSLPQSIAINAAGDTIYWTGLAYFNAQINVISSDFDNDIVVMDSQSALRGIAIDPVDQKIYWISTNLTSGPKIWRANMDGTSPVVLIDFGTGSSSTPRAISLDVRERKMYWTNFGEGNIQCADMSESAVPEDILVGLKGPSGLAVDADSGKIFWTEMNGHQIKCADLNGANEILLISNLSYPNSIAVDRSKNRMAWTEMGSGKVKSAELDGSDIFDYEVNASAPTGIIIEPSSVSVVRDSEITQLPAKFDLGQNYPNPFNPNTQIKFALPQNAWVTIEVFDILGRKLKVLVDENMQAGYHKITFIAENLTSGVYLYRMQAGDFILTKKMQLLK